MKKEKNNLKESRQKVDKTQLQVAREVGICERVYQKYENSESLPNIKTAIKIANVLGINDLRMLWNVQ